MTEPVIDSPSNPRIRSWRALRSRRERDRTGTVFIEGRRETLRALEHLDPVALILRADVLDIDAPTPVVVSERAFAALSVRQHPDGVAGVFEIPDHRVSTVSASTVELALVADGIEKPGNIGAMIRTADAFGAAFVGSSLGTDLFNPNVVRSAQGSLFAGITLADERDDVLEWIGAEMQIVIASVVADARLWDVDLTTRTAVVIGSEHEGVTGRWYDIGLPVSIPTRGAADSLNASVAAAVFLAEAARQRST